MIAAANDNLAISRQQALGAAVSSNRTLQAALPKNISYDEASDRLRDKETGQYVAASRVSEQYASPTIVKEVSNSLTGLETQFYRMDAYTDNISTIKKVQAEAAKDAAREALAESRPGPDLTDLSEGEGSSNKGVVEALRRLSQSLAGNNESIISKTIKTVGSVIGLLFLADMLSGDEAQAAPVTPEEEDPAAQRRREVTPEEKDSATEETGRRAGAEAEDDYSDLPPAGSSQNADIAMNYFMSQGWTRAQAAGIVGNLQGESTAQLDPNSFNPNDAGPGLHSYGIAQWNRARWLGLQSYARSQGKPWNDFQTQLEYVQRELSSGGDEVEVGRALSTAQTAEDAAVIMTRYERFKGYELGERSPETRQRMANARALAAARSSGNERGGATMGDTTRTFSAQDVSNFTRPRIYSPVRGRSGNIVAMQRAAGIRISSTYRSADRPNHEGYDIAAPEGTPIYPMAYGRVSQSYRSDSYGETVVIQHGIVNGASLSTLYAHMHTRNVNVNDMVNDNTIIGTVGNTGQSRGNHLHFEYMVNDQATALTNYNNLPARLLGPAPGTGQSLTPQQMTTPLSVVNPMVDALTLLGTPYQGAAVDQSTVGINGPQLEVHFARG